MRIRALKNYVLISVAALGFSSTSFAGDDDDGPTLKHLPHEVQSLIFRHFRLTEMENWYLTYPDVRRGVLDARTANLAPTLTKLDQQFVQIPAGRLPGGTEIDPFEADRYPVTQELWEEIMGYLPEGVQPDCPRCPITHVNWENKDGSDAEVQEFALKLNWAAENAGQRCFYYLPSDDELLYIIRADPTGTNQDPFSTGVTEQNVNYYLWHSGNSDRRIQPVGQKTLNDFGIELGNVWKMSRSLRDPEHPEWGRSVRGGSWYDLFVFARSGGRVSTGAGGRVGNLGFALVRTCQ